MSTILSQAQALVSELQTLMPSIYQQNSLQALLGLFLEGQGFPLPEHCQTKSASALSRFLNEYKWSTRQVIRAVRQTALQQILSQPRIGRRPTLQVILDLTTLEKVGKFKAFQHLIRVYNGKRGLHVVLLYLVVGQWRLPWGFQVYRGRDTSSPVELGLRLLRRLPKILTQHFDVLVLADTAFGSNEFVTRVRQLQHHVLVGVSCNRKLEDGRRLRQLHKRGIQVRLPGLNFPVSISWYYFKRSDGKWQKRYVLSTKALKASTIDLVSQRVAGVPPIVATGEPEGWGRRRWAVEGFFKTVKHRFGLHRFGESALREGFPPQATANPKGQQTILGVYRWLVLSLTAYLLAHWAHLYVRGGAIPDWGEAAQKALELMLPMMALFPLLAEIQRLKPLTNSYGLEIHVNWCKLKI